MTSGMAQLVLFIIGLFWVPCAGLICSELDLFGKKISYWLFGASAIFCAPGMFTLWVKALT